MKTVFTTIAIGLTMLSAKAGHFSALKLKMFDNTVFSVILDDQQFKQSHVFSTPKIAPGYHKLKVVRYVPGPYGYPSPVTVYKGWITIPAKAVVYAMIDCHRQFDIVKVDPYFKGNGWGQGGYNPGYGSGHGPGPGYGHGHGYGPGPDPADGSGYAPGYGNGWNSDEDDFGPEGPGYDPGSGWNQEYMSEMEYMHLKRTIAGKSFETTKLEIAKQALAQNTFSSAQVADMLQLFSFESNKLDFAKAAYGKVFDKKNYHLVSEALTYESSIQDLNKFIARK